MSLTTIFSSCNIVFERHGVHYSLEGGSAIGAIRHQGLIPWDDDIDIAVLVEDKKLLLGPVANDLGGVVDIFVPAPSFFLSRYFMTHSDFLQNKITALFGLQIHRLIINSFFRTIPAQL